MTIYAVPIPSLKSQAEPEASYDLIPDQVKQLIEIQKAPELNLYLYGFKALFYSLTVFHRPKKGGWLTNRLAEELHSHTDIDLLICPSNHTLQNLNDFEALTYYQRIEKAVTGQYTPAFGSETSHQFRNFKSDTLDCSLQRKPIDAHIHSSCQVFVDIHQHQFIFKNEACYKHFLKRQIYTPELKNILTQAKLELSGIKNKIIQVRTLCFIFKNHLKMRTLRWILSDHDRKILQEDLFNDQTRYPRLINGESVSKTLEGWLDYYLDSWQTTKPESFHFMPSLMEDFPGKRFNSSLLMALSDWDNCEYLKYNSKESTATQIEAIQWMMDHELASPVEKSESIERYMQNLRADEQQKKFNFFIDNAPSAMLVYLASIPSLKKHIPVAQYNHSGPSSAPPLVCYSRKNHHVSAFCKQAQAQLNLINDKMKSEMAEEFRFFHHSIISHLYKNSPFQTLIYLCIFIFMTGWSFSDIKFISYNKKKMFNYDDILIVCGLILLDRLANSFFYMYQKDSPVIQLKTSLFILEMIIKKHEADELEPPFTVMGYHLQTLHYIYKNSHQNEYYKINLKSYTDTCPSHAEMLVYFSAMIGPRCQLNGFEHNYSDLMSLICAVADHFGIKSLHHFWEAPVEEKYIENLVYPDDAKKKASQALEGLAVDKYCTKSLETLASALVVLKNLDPYENKFPTLVSFIKVKQADSDFGVKYKIFFKPYAYFCEDRTRKEKFFEELKQYLDSKRHSTLKPN